MQRFPKIPQLFGREILGMNYDRSVSAIAPNAATNGGTQFLFGDGGTTDHELFIAEGYVHGSRVEWVWGTRQQTLACIEFIEDSLNLGEVLNFGFDHPFQFRRSVRGSGVS